MKFLFIGDSLTYGYNVGRKENWVYLLQQKYDIEVINAGINGDETENIKLRLGNYLEKDYFDFVFVMGGANDLILCDENSKVAINNLEQMVELIKQNNSTPILGIQTPIYKELCIKEWGDNVDYDFVITETCKIREWIINYCKENSILYIDFYSYLYKHINDNNVYRYSMDGLHQTKEGNRIMANIACNLLDKIIN